MTDINLKTLFNEKFVFLIGLHIIISLIIAFYFESIYLVAIEILGILPYFGFIISEEILFDKLLVFICMGVVLNLDLLFIVFLKDNYEHVSITKYEKLYLYIKYILINTIVFIIFVVLLNYSTELILPTISAFALTTLLTILITKNQHKIRKTYKIMKKSSNAICENKDEKILTEVKEGFILDHNTNRAFKAVKVGEFRSSTESNFNMVYYFSLIVVIGGFLNSVILKGILYDINVISLFFDSLGGILSFIDSLGIPVISDIILFILEFAFDVIEFLFTKVFNVINAIFSVITDIYHGFLSIKTLFLTLFYLICIVGSSIGVYIIARNNKKHFGDF